MATFGYTANGDSLMGQKGDNTQCYRFTLGENGDVSKLSMYCISQWGDGASRIKGCIYDVAANIPDALQGTTNEATTPDALAWVDLNFPAPVSLVAADYFLCFNAGPVGWKTAVRYLDNQTAAYFKEDANCAYVDFAEDPFGGVTWSDDLQLCIYATYTTGVASKRLLVGVGL